MKLIVMIISSTSILSILSIIAILAILSKDFSEPWWKTVTVTITVQNMVNVSKIPHKESSTKGDSEYNNRTRTTMRTTKDKCPKIGLIAAEYRVVYIPQPLDKDPPKNGGCAIINFNTTDPRKKRFSLWYGELHANGTERCRENRRMIHFYFYCDLEPIPENTDNGTMYEQLMGQSASSTFYAEPAFCAMHDMLEGDGTTFRMVISVRPSCSHLSGMMRRKDEDYVFNENHRMAFLLQFDRRRLIADPSLDDDSYDQDHSSRIVEY